MVSWCPAPDGVITRALEITKATRFPNTTRKPGPSQRAGLSQPGLRAVSSLALLDPQAHRRAIVIEANSRSIHVAQNHIDDNPVIKTNLARASTDSVVPIPSYRTIVP